MKCVDVVTQLLHNFINICHIFLFDLSTSDYRKTNGTVKAVYDYCNNHRCYKSTENIQFRWLRGNSIECLHKGASITHRCVYVQCF